jgi:predicted outer membrane repeat protein
LQYGGSLRHFPYCFYLSDNVVVSNNKAEIGGGIYAAFNPNNLLSDDGVFSISDNVAIKENNASYGGGIFSNMNISIKNNTSLSKNTANIAGGGIYISSGNSPKISVSGDSNQAVSFSQNKAGLSGGAVFISGLDNLDKYKSFEKTESSNLKFLENSAEKGYFWHLAGSDFSANMTYVKDNLPVLANTTVTTPFFHAYNNHDIAFVDDSFITTVDYFADSPGTNKIGSFVFFYSDSAITESGLAFALGNDWLNLYQPAGYQTGQLQETLPLTLGIDTLLNVLYLADDSGDDSGGGTGTGTGSAVVVPMPDMIPEPPEPELPNEEPPKSPWPDFEIEYPEKLAIVILLFPIAIVFYLFVFKRENEYNE